MSNRRIALSTIACAAIAFIASSSTALAQSDYPSKPVKIIVPFPAGGTSDVMGRLIAEELGKILKQPFIVENIGGAGGVIGTERGVKAAPDGYTLMLANTGVMVINPGLYSKLPYQTLRDFTPIARTATRTSPLPRARDGTVSSASGVVAEREVATITGQLPINAR